MASSHELVNSTFTLAQQYATAADTKLAVFTSKLNDAIYTPPTLSVTWNSLQAPTFEAVQSS